MEVSPFNEKENCVVNLLLYIVCIYIYIYIYHSISFNSSTSENFCRKKLQASRTESPLFTTKWWCGLIWRFPKMGCSPTSSILRGLSSIRTSVRHCPVEISVWCAYRVEDVVQLDIDRTCNQQPATSRASDSWSSWLLGFFSPGFVGNPGGRSAYIIYLTALATGSSIPSSTLGFAERESTNLTGIPENLD